MKKFKFLRRLCTLFVSLSLVMSVFSGSMVSVSAAENEPTIEDTAEGTGNYDAYLSSFSSSQSVSTSVDCDISKAVSDNGSYKKYLDRSAVILENSSSATFTVDVKETGLYGIQLDYASTGNSNSNFVYSVAVDGNIPFDNAQMLTLSKLWRDIREKDGGFKTDSYGNRLTPRQEECPAYQKAMVRDTDGIYDKPFQFYFTAGQHTITLIFEYGGIAIAGLTLRNDPEPITYNTQKNEYKNENYQPSHATLDVQGEDAALKSDSVLHPTFDRVSQATVPSDPFHIMQNTIGQSNWMYTGQWLQWTVDIPETGLYNISIRARQNLMRGVKVGRRFLIDDKLPFAELNKYQFPFSDTWYTETLGSGKEAYQFYFTRGKHTIRMEVCPTYADLTRNLQGLVYELNNLYRKIIMITGTSPDPYRDYQLDNEIPGFGNTVKELHKKLSELRGRMTGMGFAKGSEAVIVEQLITQLKTFIDRPDSVTTQLKLMNDNISAAAAWVLNLKNQPLEIDYIRFHSAEKPKPEATNGFFREFGYSFQCFVASFLNDYTMLDNKEAGKETINVWVGLGRDQAQVVKQLTDDYFADTYHEKVSINLVQQGLIPATLTGRGPDVALFINPNDVVNLAARNAVVDISSFEGFGEVTKRFHSQSIIPYQYMNGTYGLPVNESFFMMFLRTDILKELNIKTPTTWQEFYKIIPVLQRNNLTVGIQSTETTFQNLLYQMGGSYYQDGWKKTGFDTPEAISAFKQWTDFFSKYTLPVEMDFYSRFRTGEAPIGIMPYTTYNMLSVAAPEIKGLWEIAPIPGYVREDGSVNRSAAGMGTGMVLFSKTKNKSGAWKFMQWWTSDETQSRFSKELEILMGPAARFDTPNVNAFKTLAWSKEDKEKLLSQWDSLIMVPQTPVNYYIGRNLLNAFRRVVYSNQNPRESLNFYNRDINKEIERKRKEFGLN